VGQARADLAQAKINLDRTIITSPIDGVVVSRNVDVGQTVAASLQAPTLFTIANDLTKMEVLASIDEADVGRVKEGQRTTFTVDAYSGETFVGIISQLRLNPITTQNVVTYSAVVMVDNPQEKLRPGMTANITIPVEERLNVLKVPNAALRFRPPRDDSGQGGFRGGRNAGGQGQGQGSGQGTGAQGTGQGPQGAGQGPQGSGQGGAQSQGTQGQGEAGQNGQNRHRGQGGHEWAGKNPSGEKPPSQEPTAQAPASQAPDSQDKKDSSESRPKNKQTIWVM